MFRLRLRSKGYRCEFSMKLIMDGSFEITWSSIGYISVLKTVEITWSSIEYISVLKTVEITWSSIEYISVLKTFEITWSSIEYISVLKTNLNEILSLPSAVYLCFKIFRTISSFCRNNIILCTIFRNKKEEVFRQGNDSLTNSRNR